MPKTQSSEWGCGGRGRDYWTLQDGCEDLFAPRIRGLLCDKLPMATCTEGGPREKDVAPLRRNMLVMSWNRSIAPPRAGRDQALQAQATIRPVRKVCELEASGGDPKAVGGYRGQPHNAGDGGNGTMSSGRGTDLALLQFINTIEHEEEANLPPCTSS